MERNTKILIVEDEQNISDFITAVLSSNGYGVIHATKGKEAISLTATHGPDLILLDLGLPDIDGMKVLRSIREWSDVPILVVSAREEEREKVEALDAGADDYITKPFGNHELLARMRTAIRLHRKINNGKSERRDCISIGSLVIDYIKRLVEQNGCRIHLTPIEYKIVVLLSQHAGRVLTHDFIIREVWGPYESDSQVLRVNMANIRRKLEENPADPRYILTEVGVGYRMVDSDNVSR